jgi:hypothetical protein
VSICDLGSPITFHVPTVKERQFDFIGDAPTNGLRLPFPIVRQVPQYRKIFRILPRHEAVQAKVEDDCTLDEGTWIGGLCADLEIGASVDHDLRAWANARFCEKKPLLRGSKVCFNAEGAPTVHESRFVLSDG